MYKEIFNIPHICLAFNTLQPVIAGIQMIRCIDSNLQFTHWALMISLLGFDLVIDPARYGEEE